MAVTDIFIKRVKAQIPQSTLAFLFACDCFVHGLDPSDRGEKKRGEEKEGTPFGKSKLYLYLPQKCVSKPLRKKASWTKDVGQIHERHAIDLIL